MVGEGRVINKVTILIMTYNPKLNKVFQSHDPPSKLEELVNKLNGLPDKLSSQGDRLEKLARENEKRSSLQKDLNMLLGQVSQQGCDTLNPKP